MFKQRSLYTKYPLIFPFSDQDKRVGIVGVMVGGESINGIKENSLKQNDITYVLVTFQACKKVLCS